MTDLVDRLRGIYRIPITDGLGPVETSEDPNSPSEFVRTFPTPPIQLEAAAEIERLQRAAEETTVFIRTMRLSDDREEHWVVVRVGDRQLDVRRYPGGLRNRAQYEVDEWRHLLLGHPKPEITNPIYGDPHE